MQAKLDAMITSDLIYSLLQWNCDDKTNDASFYLRTDPTNNKARMQQWRLPKNSIPMSGEFHCDKYRNHK